MWQRQYLNEIQENYLPGSLSCWFFQMNKGEI
jgi:hypothetical protein